MWAKGSPRPPATACLRTHVDGKLMAHVGGWVGLSTWRARTAASLWNRANELPAPARLPSFSSSREEKFPEENIPGHFNDLSAAIARGQALCVC